MKLPGLRIKGWEFQNLKTRVSFGTVGIHLIRGSEGPQFRMVYLLGVSRE